MASIVTAVAMAEASVARREALDLIEVLRLRKGGRETLAKLADDWTKLPEPVRRIRAGDPAWLALEPGHRDAISAVHVLALAHQERVEGSLWGEVARPWDVVRLGRRLHRMSAQQMRLYIEALTREDVWTPVSADVDQVATTVQARSAPPPQGMPGASGSPDSIRAHMPAAWKEMSQRLAADAAEWGGARLLLQVIPGPHGHIHQKPPFAIEMVEFGGPTPRSYPASVLRVEGRDYVFGNPHKPEAGSVTEGTVPQTAARWGLYWFGTRVGWDKFLALATETGKLLAPILKASPGRFGIECLHPSHTGDPAIRWMLALFAMGHGHEPSAELSAPRYVVDHNHHWIEVPRNRPAREELIREHPGATATRLSKDPMDDFVAVLIPEVFAASAAAGRAIMAISSETYDQSPLRGADPHEQTAERHTRILLLLMKARESDPAGFGSVRWRSIPGVTQSDLSYLMGEKWIGAGFRHPAGKECFGDPNYLEVWLETGGVRRALELGAQERASALPEHDQSNLFRRAGNVWEVRFEGVGGFIKDTDGMRYLSELLRHPNPTKPIRSLDLAVPPTGVSDAEHTADPVLDDLATEQARERLDEIEHELEDAATSKDEPKQIRLVGEKKGIAAQLAAGLGLGGRARPLGPKSPAETARVRVRQALDVVDKNLREARPSLDALADHLNDSIKIRSGAWSYRPTTTPDWAF